MDDTVTATAYSGSVGNATEEASASFTVADAHALPAPAAITVTAKDAADRTVASVPEGGAVELTVSVDRGRGNTASTGEALSVALSLAPSDTAQASTYRLAPARVDLPAVMPPDGKQSASTVIRLEALADEFVNDDRLTLNLVTTGEAVYGPGSVDSSFEIDVQDTTVKQIAPKPDSAVKQAFDAARAVVAGADGLNPGEAFSVAVSELFDMTATGGTVVYSASSSDPSVQVSASTTAVTAGGTSGTAVLRATDDDKVEETEILTVTATGPGKVLVGTVEIELVDNDTADYEFLGPSDPNLVEGETYELKVWASAASSRDATFVVRRDRAASDAGEDDFILEPASIVIKAGAREGTASLKVVDDGLDERSEALVIEATAAGGDDVGSLAFTLWDASVPMLPWVGQFWLAVVLAIGGYRRYLRR